MTADSADSEARAMDQIAEAWVNFPVRYALTVPQMQQLSLYISSPRHGLNIEGPFAEPGLFAVNEEGESRMVDIAKVAFFRPQLGSLVGELRFMRGKIEDFPANGTFA